MRLVGAFEVCADRADPATPKDLASGPSQLKSWIQGFKLDACVGGCELPIGFGVMFISPFLPCGGFFGEGFAVRDPAVETLADENSDLGLGHVEPAAVLGRIVPNEALDEPPRLLGREGFV